MDWRVVLPDHWPAFLRSFGDRHASWLVRLAGTIDTPADYVALRELRLDQAGDGDVVLRVGDVDDPIELRFADPRIIRVDMSAEGIERGLWIESADGELTLGFRTAIAPELVDGPPCDPR
jgi:hypothetical protein